MKFNNRVALITGAAGNIGKAIASKFCESGVSVILTDLSQKKLDETIESIGGDHAKVFSCEMDITDSGSVKHAKETILQHFPRIDILINNAGVWNHRKGQCGFSDTPEDEWQRILDINLYGTFRVTQAFLSLMIRQRYGRIINVGSIAGEVGLPGYCDYATAKAGIIMMTKTLAMELAKDQITVNCVSPGMVGATEETSSSSGTWIGRTGKPSEIAELIVFLAGDNSGFLTGVDYTIDGGRILGPKAALF